MLVQMRFNGHSIVYVVVPPSVETRADAVTCEVRPADVPTSLVVEIERVVRMASRTLHLDLAPQVRWLPSDTKNIRGVVFDEALAEIWVKVQTPEATRDTALHELRHVWQLRGDRYKSAGLLTMEQRQADADDFAATWTWEMTPPVIDQAARRAEWERVWRPVHEATAREYAERYTARRHRGGPMLRANLQAPAKRREYTVKGVVHVVCEQCEEGVPLNTTHRCPAAPSLSGASGYDVKVVR